MAENGIVCWTPESIDGRNLWVDTGRSANLCEAIFPNEKILILISIKILLNFNEIAF